MTLKYFRRGSFVSHSSLKDGQLIVFTEELAGQVGNVKSKFNVKDAELMGLLDKIGHTLLPTYIQAPRGVSSEKKTRNRYQIVYAKNTGAVELSELCLKN